MKTNEMKYEYWIKLNSGFLHRFLAENDSEVYEKLEKEGIKKEDIKEAVKFVPVVVI